MISGARSNLGRGNEGFGRNSALLELGGRNADGISPRLESSESGDLETSTAF